MLILLLIVVLICLLALFWSQVDNWGYGPIGIVTALLMLIVVLMVTGQL